MLDLSVENKFCKKITQKNAGIGGKKYENELRCWIKI